MAMTKASLDSLKWAENKALPPGSLVAVMVGDPTKAGSIVVQRVKFPANYQVPPHTHPYDETVTIMTGAVRLGMGEKVDPSGVLDPPGTFFANPAKNAHYVVNGPQESIIQVQFVAPGGIDYINPQDDPRK
jgi:quercetin dioxygenase-like cupin family protein